MELSKWEQEAEEKYAEALKSAKPGDKAVVSMTSSADATITVKITNDMIARVQDPDGTINVDALRELIEEKAYDLVPNICAQCGGWGDERTSLSIGDEWDVHPGGTQLEVS